MDIRSRLDRILWNVLIHNIDDVQFYYQRYSFLDKYHNYYSIWDYLGKVAYYKTVAPQDTSYSFFLYLIR